MDGMAFLSGRLPAVKRALERPKSSVWVFLSPSLVPLWLSFEVGPGETGMSCKEQASSQPSLSKATSVDRSGTLPSRQAWPLFSSRRHRRLATLSKRNSSSTALPTSLPPCLPTFQPVCLPVCIGNWSRHYSHEGGKKTKTKNNNRRIDGRGWRNSPQQQQHVHHNPRPNAAYCILHPKYCCA